jgi:hypothetical protein
VIVAGFVAYVVRGWLLPRVIGEQPPQTASG